MSEPARCNTSGKVSENFLGKKIHQVKTKELSNGVNSIIHFDYFLGDTIAIEKLKSSIIINNKGELLFPKKDFGKRSEVRNRLLVDLLSRTEFMEKAGTGIQRITDACKANGNNCTFDFTDAFWITINSNNVTDDTDDVTDNVTDNVTGSRKNQIIRLIQENNQISMTQLAKKLSVTKMTIVRDIARLKEDNIIKRIGPAKGGHWQVVDK